LQGLQGLIHLRQRHNSINHLPQLSAAGEGHGIEQILLRATDRSEDL
jgi:hypothetical protein